MNRERGQMYLRPPSEQRGVALKYVTLEPTSYALHYGCAICESSKCNGWKCACTEFRKWAPMYAWIWMHAPSLDVIMGRWPIWGFGIPGMMPIYQWDGNEGCMDDPNQGLWLGCSQSGRLHAMWPTWWWTNVECMRYRHTVVSACALVERLMMIVSVTRWQWVHASPRWSSWYSFTSC